MHTVASSLGDLMALIVCPECGRRLTEKALYCPYCGCDPEELAPGFPSSFRVGHYFRLGSWGRVLLDWRILEVSGNQALALSEYGVDQAFFNASGTGNSWNSSDLKAWLEGTFLPQAFSYYERNRIREITCLSVDEAYRYCSSDFSRKCVPTPYAQQRGVQAVEGRCFWWLRSPGTQASHSWFLRPADNKSNRAAIVSPDGLVNEYGFYVNSPGIAVRPAIWLNL